MSDSTSASNGRTYGGLSQEERKAIRREQFLQAGLAVFGSDGFRAATVRRLCREAKLTDRYFYQSFGSLESLLTAVYERCMGQIRARIEAVIAGAHPGIDADKLIHDALDVFFTELEDPRVARVCMVELEGVSPEVDQLYHGYIRRFAELILGLTQQVYPHWRLSEDESLMMAISLVGAMRQAATHWLLSGYAMDRKTVVQAATRIVIGLINQVESEQA